MSILSTDIIPLIKAFKIQFYFFLIFTVGLTIFRIVRVKTGKKYSKSIIIYPLLYFFLTLYSSITLTFAQFEFFMILYLFGLISGFIIGDLSIFKTRKGEELYESSGTVAFAWSLLFLVKWYTFLYDQNYPLLLDPVITLSFTLLAGILFGEALGIIFKHRAVKG